jgi:hypothetical protein
VRGVTEKEDFNDIVAEESTRGRRQPKKAVTLARQRMIKKLADILAEPGCDKRTFLAVIRDFGIKDESPEFLQLCDCGMLATASRQRAPGRLDALVLFFGGRSRKVPRNNLREPTGKLARPDSSALSSHR